MKRTRVTPEVLKRFKAFTAEHPEARVEEVAAAVGISASTVRRAISGGYDHLLDAQGEEQPRLFESVSDVLEAFGPTAKNAIEAIEWGATALLGVYKFERGELVNAIATNISNDAAIIDYIIGCQVARFD